MQAPCISTSEIKEWSSSKQLKAFQGLFYETSVVTGTGINTAFQDILKELVKERNIKPST